MKKEISDEIDEAFDTFKRLDIIKRIENFVKED